MAWQTNSGGWTQVGSPSSPALWIFGARMTSTGALVIQTTDPAKPAGITIYSDPAGANRYEVICDGGTGGNIEIFKYTQGTPGAALDTAAHGLGTGIPYTMEARWVNGVISVYLNGSTTPIVEHDTANDLALNTCMGLASQTNGATVGSARIYTLSQTFASLADVAWWVANGTLWASDSGRSGARAIGAFFDPAASVTVVGAEDLQHAIIVDGTHAVDFDAVAMTAEPFELTAGKMPGQSNLNTPPGATTAKIALSYNSRVGFLQEQYAIFSRIGDRTDLDLTVDDDGKAFVWPSQVGQPLVGAIVAAKNRLIMWGRSSTWELTGDPILGGDVTRIGQHTGGTGPYAATMVEDGIIAMHADQGLQIIRSGGNPEPLSESVLTDIIQTDNAADTMYVTVALDTKSFGLWIFLTPADGSLGRFVWYDKRTGAYNPGNGGFWPMTFGDAGAQATCAMRYQGEVVFGTMDGQMLFFDKAAKTDASHDFSATLTMAMVKPEEQDLNVAVWDFDLIMGLGSDDTTIEIYGGDTPERAFASDAWLLWSGDMTLPRDSFSPGVSAPALAMRLTSSGARWAFESLQVAYGHEPLIPMPRRNELAGTAPCVPDSVRNAGTGGGEEEPDEGPGPGEDPGTTVPVACPLWMADHTTGNVSDGTNTYAAYKIAGPVGVGGDLYDALTDPSIEPVLRMIYNSITESDLTDGSAGHTGWNHIDILAKGRSNSQNNITWIGTAGVDGILYTGHGGPTDPSGWDVYFRCEDQTTGL